MKKTNDHNIYKTKKMHWYAVGWVIPVEPRPFGSITNNQSADNIIDCRSFVTFCNKIKTYLHENTISTDMVITQVQIQKNKEVKIQCLSHKYKYERKIQIQNTQIQGQQISGWFCEWPPGEVWLLQQSLLMLSACSE